MNNFKRIPPEKISTFTGYTVVVVGIIILAGWNFEIKSLQSTFLEGMPVRPSAAAAVILAGLGLIIFTRLKDRAFITVRTLGILVALIGVISAANQLSIWSVELENIFLFYSSGTSGAFNRTTVPLNSAFNFISLGIVFIVLTFRSETLYLLEFFLFFILSISLTVLGGYIFGYEILIGLSSVQQEQMALSLALLFILISSVLVLIIFQQKERKLSFEEKLFPLLTMIFVFGVVVTSISLSAFSSIEGQNDIIIQLKNIAWINFLLLFLLLTIVFIIVKKDALRRKKAEEELKHINKKLKEREKLLSEANRELENLVDERSVLLNKSEERFKTTLENLIEGCQVIDFEYRYVYINNAAAEHGRFSKTELLGKKMTDIYFGIEDTEMFSLLKKCMEERSPYKMENKFNYPDGSSKWFYLSMEPVPEGVFIMSTDISDKKRAENELHKLNEELEEIVKARTEQLEAVNKELESFSYSVSHDLRAPLRHINGFIDMLKVKSADKLDEKGLRYLNIIKDAATQMGQLIDDLLTFSRIGRSTVSKTKLSFNKMISEIIEQNKDEIEQRGIKIKIADMPPVEADPNLMRQVWFNLIANAIKYTKQQQEPEIEIGFEKQNNEFVFFVKDNGAGFDMAYYDKLFGVFQRLHSQEEFEGTGIGLANVKRIINKHKGKVWAEGKENHGAVFYFSLPG